MLTTALIAARFFGGHLVLGQRYMVQHWGQNRLDKSGFTRQLHALNDTLLALFATCGLIQHFRKSIKTPVSQLTARFPKQIHTVTAGVCPQNCLIYLYA